MDALEKVALDRLREMRSPMSIWNCPAASCDVEGVQILSSNGVPYPVSCPVCSKTLRIAL